MQGVLETPGDSTGDENIQPSSENSHDEAIIDCREIDLQEASSELSEKLAEGHIAAVKFGTVYALICDARNPDSVAFVRKIKERPATQPFGLLLDPNQLLNPNNRDDYGSLSMEEKKDISLIDWDRVDPSVENLLMSPDEMRNIFGNHAFVRLPLKTSNPLDGDEYLDSTYNVQIFTWYGNQEAYEAESLIRQSLKDIHPEGLGEILVTSYNRHNEPSITEVEAARQFSRSVGVGLQVNHNGSSNEGSYPIYAVKADGVYLLRSFPEQSANEVYVEEALKSKGIEVKSNLF